MQREIHHSLGDTAITGSVVAGREGIHDAMEIADRFLGVAELAVGATFRLRIIIEELLTNTIVHGGGAGTTVELALEKVGEDVCIGVVDRGTPFDPRADLPVGSPEDAVTSGTEGGIGWAMILQWCRIDSYARENGEKSYARFWVTA